MFWLKLIKVLVLLKLYGLDRIAKYIVADHRLADLVEWEGISYEGKYIILLNHPSLIKYMKVDELMSGDVRHLIERNPELAKDLPRHKLDSRDLRKLLIDGNLNNHLCNWSKLDGDDWYQLLIHDSAYAGVCDFTLITGWNWVILIGQNAVFSQYCDWGKLDGACWTRLLTNHPEYSDKCDWAKLNVGNWNSLLAVRPRFQEYIEYDVFTSRQIIQFNHLDEFIFRKHCDWNDLEFKEIQEVISKMPNLLVFYNDHLMGIGANNVVSVLSDEILSVKVEEKQDER